MRISDWSSDVCSSDLLAPGTIPDTFGQIKTLLDDLETAVSTRSGTSGTSGTRPTLRDSGVSEATPSEIFRDKLAYRNEVKAALEQAQPAYRSDLENGRE